VILIGLGNLGSVSFTSEANGVSADGSVVVGHGNSASGPEAFRWEDTGTCALDNTGPDPCMVGMGDLAGVSFRSRASGASANGSVVVGSASSTLSLYEAFRWDAGGGMVGLGLITGHLSSSSASASSADGSVVVGYGNSASGAEAFRWTSGGGMVGLGNLPGGFVNSHAYGVSANGSVIVGESRVSSTWEAFRWTQAGGMVSLGDLPGGNVRSRAYGVSADGSVVVGIGDSAAGYEAFVWDSANGMRTIHQVLTNAGIDLTGWTLTRANGVSADGRAVVGYGTNPLGRKEAFLAVLPAESNGEPVPALPSSGIALLALALLCVGSTRFRRDSV
jgi:probable HAF family extracellular repeat protein